MHTTTAASEKECYIPYRKILCSNLLKCQFLLHSHGFDADGITFFPKRARFN